MMFLPIMSTVVAISEGALDIKQIVILTMILGSAEKKSLMKHRDVLLDYRLLFSTM